MEGVGRTMWAGAVVGVAILAMLLLPGLASTTSASPVPQGSTNSQQWAYGTQKWFNVSFSVTNGTYSSTAYFGWQVIYTATNTSATTVMLEAQRTMAGRFSAQFCTPTCTAPTAQGTLNVSGWEKDAGFANLTTAASVWENGSAVPAVGLMNAHSEGSGNLSEALQYSFQANSKTWSASQSLYVSGQSHAQLNFTTALGLVPLNVSAGDTWNSTAAYSAAGAWAINATWARTTLLGSHMSGAPSASNSLASTGSVSLGGSDAGLITLANGQTVPMIVVSWAGPFDDFDGIVLVPHDYDLFGGATQSYSADSMGTQTVATSSLDLSVGADHHLRVVAAASSYSAADTSLAIQASTTSGPAPAASTTGGSGSNVQAQPESVAQAQQASSCLVGGCAGTAGGHLSGVLVAVLVVGLVAAVILGTVGVVGYRLHAIRRSRGGPGGSASPVPPPGAVVGTPPPPAGPGSPPSPPA